MNDNVQAELKKIFNGRFSTSESTRANYARGEDTYDPVLSKAVVFPETNEEVSKVLKLCNEIKFQLFLLEQDFFGRKCRWKYKWYYYFS